MPEKMLDGVKVIELSKYNYEMSVLLNRIRRLSRTIGKLKGQYKADCIALNRFKERHPAEYWGVMNSLKEEYGSLGRIISEPNGLQKVIDGVLERDSYRCIRCGVFGVKINEKRTDLTIDHIFEKVDGAVRSR